MPSTRTQKPHHLKKRKKPGLMPQTKPLSPPPLHCHCPRATFNYHLGGQAIQHKRHARPGKKQRRSLSLALSSVRWLVGPKRSPSQVVSLYFGTDDNHSARHPASPEHQHHTLFFLLLYLVSVGRGETWRQWCFWLERGRRGEEPLFCRILLPPSLLFVLLSGQNLMLIFSSRCVGGEERGRLGFFLLPDMRLAELSSSSSA